MIGADFDMVGHVEDIFEVDKVVELGEEVVALEEEFDGLDVFGDPDFPVFSENFGDHYFYFIDDNEKGK